MTNRDIGAHSEPDPSAHILRPASICPYCEGTKITRKGKRKNKYGDVQLYYCRFCARRFSTQVNRHRTYPMRVITEALTAYNRCYSCSEVAALINSRYGLNVTRQNITLWVRNYSEHLLFLALREQAAQTLPRHKWIARTRLHHGLVYDYKFHRAKTELLLQTGRRNRRFRPLQDHLELLHTSCPHELFKMDRPRASQGGAGFNHDDLKITPRHDNAAVEMARFVLQSVANNKLRHEKVQEFMLVNDSATIAVEVPVLLRAEDIAALKDSYTQIPAGLEQAALITGHIDIVQIRGGLVQILDFKPGAKREKPTEQLMIYALALSHQTGIPLYHFKCAWFDDKDFFEFFPRRMVQKAASDGEN